MFHFSSIRCLSDPDLLSLFMERKKADGQIRGVRLASIER
jgi:hypothetical protein